MLGFLNPKPHLHCHHCLLIRPSPTWCSSSGRKLQPGSALGLSPVSPLLCLCKALCNEEGTGTAAEPPWAWLGRAGPPLAQGCSALGGFALTLTASPPVTSLALIQGAHPPFKNGISIQHDSSVSFFFLFFLFFFSKSITIKQTYHILVFLQPRAFTRHCDSTIRTSFTIWQPADILLLSLSGWGKAKLNPARAAMGLFFCFFNTGDLLKK